jgi:hypothetical protein
MDHGSWRHHGHALQDLHAFLHKLLDASLVRLAGHFHNHGRMTITEESQKLRGMDSEISAVSRHVCVLLRQQRLDKG